MNYEISTTDKLAYNLYYTSVPNDVPVICIDGFIKYKTHKPYNEYYIQLRKEKLEKICQKYL